MNIRLLTLEDIDAATAIHLERFPDSRSTQLGKPFLRRMYRWFIVNYPDLALTATVDGRVVGFAVGSIGGYGRRVFRYALPQVMWGLVRHPDLLLTPRTFYLWKSYLRAFVPAPKKEKAGPNDPGIVQAWFASLAVSKSAQGSGVALIVAFEGAAKRKGADIISHTVRKDNIVAQRLYDGLGWQKALHDGSSGVAYSKRIS